MTRAVVINGQTITLEPRECPKPAGNLLAGRKKSAIRLLIEQMEPGESAFLPITTKRVQSANLWMMGKNTNRKLAYRTEGDGVRIYCVARTDRPSSVRRIEPRKAVSNGAAW